MFNDDRYFNKMLSKLEGTLNFLYKIGTIALIIVILCRLVLFPKDLFMLVDIVLLVALIGVQYLKEKVSNQFKLKFIGTILVLVGLLSYMTYGILGTGFITLFIANVTIAIFGKKKMFKWVVGSTTIGLIGLTYIREMVFLIKDTSLSRYIFDFSLMFLTVFIIRIAICGLRNAFMNNIRELDYNIQENEMMIAELKEQHEDLKESKVEIYQLAYYDSLTGLPKKNNFSSYVNHRMINVTYGTMLKADIKDFKLINSVYGSSIGDQLIELIGEVVRDFNDPLLYSCRYSGDEFLFWYESDDLVMMKQLLNKVMLEFNVRTRKFFNYTKIGFHMAYVQYPHDGSCYIQLLNKLNIAIKYSKSSDTHHVMRFKPEMEEELQHENQLKELIEDAISRRSFEIYYQEQYDVVSNKVIGLEALSRWHSDDLGHVVPDEFMPIIHKYQLASSFERLVIGKVFSDYPKIIKKYGHIPIGINISPEHLTTREFTKYFSDALMLYRINPNDIMIEITEVILRKGLEEVHDQLYKLKALGIKIAIDNFGSGYSSLNYLVKLPFDVLKVDRSFIADIEDVKVQNILRAIIQLKDNYDVKVIAEGVENKNQLEILTALGYDYIQGFLYDMPEPLEIQKNDKFSDSNIG